MDTLDPGIVNPFQRLIPSLRQRWKLKLLTLLIALLILVGLFALVSYISVRTLERETRVLAAEKARKGQALEGLRTRLRELEEERIILVQTRAPELYRLEFGKAIPINKAYFENIRFALPKREGKRASSPNTYSVSILAGRQLLDIANAAIDISFFDRAGVQIAVKQMDLRSNADSGVNTPLSDRLFSLSFPLVLNKDIRPAYFTLKVSDRPGQ